MILRLDWVSCVLSGSSNTQCSPCCSLGFKNCEGCGELGMRQLWGVRPLLSSESSSWAGSPKALPPVSLPWTPAEWPVLWVSSLEAALGHMDTEEPHDLGLSWWDADLLLREWLASSQKSTVVLFRVSFKSWLLSLIRKIVEHMNLIYSEFILLPSMTTLLKIHFLRKIA